MLLQGRVELLCGDVILTFIAKGESETHSFDYAFHTFPNLTYKFYTSLLIKRSKNTTTAITNKT